MIWIAVVVVVALALAAFATVVVLCDIEAEFRHPDRETNLFGRPKHKN